MAPCDPQDSPEPEMLAGWPAEPPPVRVLELFAGIGGMRLALAYAGLDVEAVAVEVSEQALEVYAHNFGDTGLVRRDLLGLSTAWFERQQCRIWTMSPPCQPYSRQGKVRDMEDARAKPLLHIIRVLQDVATPPEVLLLENVQNFERSGSCARLLEVLALRGFHWRSFLLSPRQFGFPNARQRFYLVAKQRRFPFSLVPTPEDAAPRDAECRPWSSIPCAGACAGAAGAAAAAWAAGAGAETEEAHQPCEACGRAAPPGSPRGGAAEGCVYAIAPVAAFLEGETGCEASAGRGEDGRRADAEEGADAWLVPEAAMRKESARCFDAVRPGCRHSLCFTKAYGRYVDGTGSVYAMPRRMAQPSSEAGDYTMRDFFGVLRYFTPREVARLLGFKLRRLAEEAPCREGCLPRCQRHEGAGCGGAGSGEARCRCPAYGLPGLEEETAGRARGARGLWQLLGNSLNPQVVALVCRACEVPGALCPEAPAPHAEGLEAAAAPAASTAAAALAPTLAPAAAAGAPSPAAASGGANVGA